jgi:hypothetical protein
VVDVRIPAAMATATADASVSSRMVEGCPGLEETGDRRDVSSRSANLFDCCGKRLFRIDGGLTFRTFAACEGKLVSGESFRRIDLNAIFVLRFAIATRERVMDLKLRHTFSPLSCPSMSEGQSVMALKASFVILQSSLRADSEHA